MQFLLPGITALLLALLPLSSAAPAASPQLLPLQDLPSSYILQVAQHPWQGRPLLQLPTTHLIGLENFTIHPPSAGLTVLPIRIPKQEPPLYALRIPSPSDDLTNTPYLAALLPASNGKPKWASAAPIFVPDPTGETVRKWRDRCPRGWECGADAWVIYSGTDAGDESQSAGSVCVAGERQPLGKLAYGGFNGHWEAVKDAPNSEGWHVYWIAEDAGKEPGVPVGTRVEIEIVPTKDGRGWGGSV
ncbi:uncharacterized protein EI97DRAFT_434172 [Westerdykella ornata]|uniref:Ubiquitin 3 binding protein But2 C-terminal domain-containing protein n=1 Tax=Westerdykella ornata TaxID=318751 RepID=A0A6A6JHR7_WESOR|nr:uncharacterized protein EI97DRAFT_434172 [Westerdykella ornata]KAF2275765.1 hypothetical protein EI97DRAFT_434172 [Westerdykella ornata]